MTTIVVSLVTRPPEGAEEEMAVVKGEVGPVF